MGKAARARSAFDMSKYRQRHIALRLAYIGQDYQGLSIQSTTENTIEAALLSALKKICLIPPDTAAPFDVRVSRCGRTDKGVSAFGNVYALMLRSRLPPLPPSDASIETAPASKESPAALQVEHSADEPLGEPLHSAYDYSTYGKGWTVPEEEVEEHDYVVLINRVLPPDIRVLAWAPVGEKFSARFACRRRTYKYFFECIDTPVAQLRSAAAVAKGTASQLHVHGGVHSGRFDDGRTASQLHVHGGVHSGRFDDGRLCVATVAAAAALLSGEHDFRNFCKKDVEHVVSFVRNIEQFTVQRAAEDPEVRWPHTAPAGAPGLYVATISANSFLYHQVRCMMAVLFVVGAGLEPLSLVSTLLDIEATPAKPQYPLAAHDSLVLWDCAIAAGTNGPLPPWGWLACRQPGWEALQQEQLLPTCHPEVASAGPVLGSSFGLQSIPQSFAAGPCAPAAATTSASAAAAVPAPTNHQACDQPFNPLPGEVGARHSNALIRYVLEYCFAMVTNRLPRQIPLYQLPRNSAASRSPPAYIPLLQRKSEMTIEEARANRTGIKKRKLELNMGKRSVYKAKLGDKAKPPTPTSDSQPEQ